MKEFKKIKDEKVLVVPRTTISGKLNQKNGDFNLDELKEILKDSVYGTRFLMEENFNFKQLIPYIAFISNDKVLVYKRSQKAGEGRLHDKYSLGVGGHVDLEDDKSKLALEVFLDAAIREVKEEIGVDISREDLDVEYFINDESDDVGKVHFGVCFIINKDFNLDQGELDIIVDRKFMNQEEITQVYDKFETWSQIFYDNIVKKLIK